MKDFNSLIDKKRVLPYSISLQQQTCKVCGRPDKFNFHISNWIWAKVVPERYQHLVVCLYCFDEFATNADIDYGPHLSEFLFVGKTTTFLLSIKRYYNDK